MVRFRIRDGDNAGKLTRPYGGRWDTLVGQYAGLWSPELGAWVGTEPKTKPQIIELAQQSIGYVQDWRHKLILAEGGRRSGKTTGSLAPKIIIALLLFAQLPGEVLSPTYRQSMNVWRALRKLTPRSWWIGLNKSEKTMTLANGSTVKLLSADRDDSARSEGVAWGAYDERQDISEVAAMNAFLSTSEGGEHFQIFETATIKEELREHHDKVVKSPKGKIYTMDSYGNPFIAHDFLDDAADFLDSAMVDREIRGKWPELKGRIYHPFRPDVHLRDYPLPFLQDATAQWLREEFEYTKSNPYYISVDPPHSAVIWKIYANGAMHAVDEVLIGADGTGGDVRDLARACKAKAPNGVVVIDPHDTGYSADVRKYFRRHGYRMTSVKRMGVEYKLTSVRSRLEKDMLFVDPRCRFYAECLEKHQYERNRPDKKACHRGYETDKQVTIEMVHIGDAGAYGVYKLFPARYDFEANERQVAA